MVDIPVGYFGNVQVGGIAVKFWRRILARVLWRCLRLVLVDVLWGLQGLDKLVHRLAILEGVALLTDYRVAVLLVDLVGKLAKGRRASLRQSCQTLKNRLVILVLQNLVALAFMGRYRDILENRLVIGLELLAYLALVDTELKACI